MMYEKVNCGFNNKLPKALIESIMTKSIKLNFITIFLSILFWLIVHQQKNDTIENALLVGYSV